MSKKKKLESKILKYLNEAELFIDFNPFIGKVYLSIANNLYEKIDKIGKKQEEIGMRLKSVAHQYVNRLC